MAKCDFLHLESAMINEIVGDLQKILKGRERSHIIPEFSNYWGAEFFILLGHFSN